MSASNVLLLVQTIVLAVTAAVIGWYTYETYLIRRETSKQNSLLAEQLDLLRQGQAHNQAKEASYVQPIFKSGGGSFSGRHATLKFFNKGGAIRNLHGEAPTLSIKLSKRHHLGADESLMVELDGIPVPQPPSIEFVLKYEDTLGNARATRFRHVFDEHEWSFEHVDA